MRSHRTIFRFPLLPLGVALLLATLLFQEGTALSTPLQGSPVLTATPDRLAEPTLPVFPSQADYGAQVYWLNCSPCHGDKGQGLTDEFRQQYPPEDQNCWTSHCHGKVTYENGFTIPRIVPALIGNGALTKFNTAANLYGFIRAAMPFQRPGVLKDDEYYQIVSFLLRENGLTDGRTEINASNAAGIVVSRATPIPVNQQPQVTQRGGGIGWYILFGVLLFVAALIFILKKYGNTTTI